jgi:mannosyltransferase OCH1-like enzyme
MNLVAYVVILALCWFVWISIHTSLQGISPNIPVNESRIGLERTTRVRLSTTQPQLTRKKVWNCSVTIDQENNHTFGIPWIIHQTYKSHVIPQPWKEWRQRCQMMNPCWQFKLWTDDDNQHLVKTHYPHLFETYQNYPHNIQRVDVARYMILHTYGGLYFDLDITCLRPFPTTTTFFQPRTFYAAQQYDSSSQDKRFRDPKQRCANAFMASSQQHPFLSTLLSTLPSESHRPILYSTGPGLLTSILNKYGSSYASSATDTTTATTSSYPVIELNKSTIFTFHYRQKKDILPCIANLTACADRYPGYLASFWAGSWLSQNKTPQA